MTCHTEKQFTGELAGLRQRVAVLRTMAAEHKQLDEALQESQQVLQKILESVTYGISAAEADGTARCQTKNR
jgi:hypothetical protein